MIPPFSLTVADLPATFFSMIEECWYANNAGTWMKRVSFNVDANDDSRCYANPVWHDQSKKLEISLVSADRTEASSTTTTTRWIGGADRTDKDSDYVDTATALN